MFQRGPDRAVVDWDTRCIHELYLRCLGPVCLLRYLLRDRKMHSSEQKQFFCSPREFLLLSVFECE